MYTSALFLLKRTLDICLSILYNKHNMTSKGIIMMNKKDNFLGVVLVICALAVIAVVGIAMISPKDNSNNTQTVKTDKKSNINVVNTPWLYY